MKKDDGFTVLHEVCNNSSNEDIAELMKLIIDR